MTPEAEALREIFLQIKPELMWLIIQSLAYTLIAGIILCIVTTTGARMPRRIDMKIATLPSWPSGTSEHEVVDETDTQYAIMIADYSRWDSKKKRVWFDKGDYPVVGTIVHPGT